ncbi:hypothetical protein [Curvibacter fontanus]
MKVLERVKSVLIFDVILRATFGGSLIWLLVGIVFYLKELGAKGECVWVVPSWLAWWINICQELGAPIYVTERSFGTSIWNGPCTFIFSPLGFIEFLIGPFFLIWVVGVCAAWVRNPKIFSQRA